MLISVAKDLKSGKKYAVFTLENAKETNVFESIVNSSIRLMQAQLEGEGEVGIFSIPEEMRNDMERILDELKLGKFIIQKMEGNTPKMIIEISDARLFFENLETSIEVMKKDGELLEDRPELVKSLEKNYKLLSTMTSALKALDEEQ